MKQIIKFIVFLPLGLFLYLVSPGFRNTVNAKMRAKSASGDDTMVSGETVLAVLAGGQNRTIGGQK